MRCSIRRVKALKLKITPKTKQTDGMVRTQGSKSFTHEETQVLLDIVDKIRPLGKQRWDELACAYNDQAVAKDWCTRDSDALKRRFMVLAYAKKPSEEWRDFMDRAGHLHQSILEEAGAAAPLSMGMVLGSMGHQLYETGVAKSGDNRTEGEGMLLLTGDEVDLVHATNGAIHHHHPFDEEYLARLSASGMDASVVAAAAAATASGSGGNLGSTGRSHTGSGTSSALSMMTPLRTGKRGRPPGSTTGSAAKRVAQQAEQVVLLSRATVELQKQLREVREALASVVETQANQSLVIGHLQKAITPTNPAIQTSRTNDKNDCTNVPVPKANDENLYAQQAAEFQQLLA